MHFQAHAKNSPGIFAVGEVCSLTSPSTSQIVSLQSPSVKHQKDFHCILYRIVVNAFI